MTDSAFWITEPTSEVVQGAGAGGNGLIWVGHGSATIATGVNYGPVRVTVDARSQEPSLDLEDWEEVVEVSIHFETDEADLESMGGAIEEEPQEMPLSAAGPGWYRLRVHARGRDEGAEAIDIDIDADPVEEYLIQSWPTPQAPEIRHKTTDTHGAEVRART
ncbi:hypothetical protein AQI95_42670 [Streptomyces yokosukanensis]|uniref:Uncharacterized protein n=1 Tax=Streptomyces yokosukanensis TaxID=67386 RepID=A0A101NMV8_9ACTN|nr:hypothetical protein AQI95_42670 [Streptomyces yokosukanensis]